MLHRVAEDRGEGEGDVAEAIGETQRADQFGAGTEGETARIRRLGDDRQQLFQVEVE